MSIVTDNWLITQDERGNRDVMFRPALSCSWVVLYTLGPHDVLADDLRSLRQSVEGLEAAAKDAERLAVTA